MALIVDPDDLTQGALTNVTDAAWTASTGVTTTITSAANLPALTAGMFFEVRDHSDPDNNGLYVESGGSPTTSSVTADKLTGANPANQAAEDINVYGNSSATANEKSVMFNTEEREVWLLEQGNLSADGVTEQALYSFTKEEWKNDNFLIRFDFPMITITPEQFEFQLDWNLRDDAGESVRTTKLIRTGGWSELDQSGVLQKQYAGVVTLGTFEDSVTDTAYYQLGTDETDTAAGVDFDFAGPVNEAILVYDNITPADAVTGFDFVDGGGGNDQLNRNDAGSWVTDGYVVGGQVEVANATTPANNGTYTILAVTATDIDVPTASITADTGDNTATFAVDNRNSVKLFLRVRDGDPNGKTFDFSDLPAIGQTEVDNKVFRFPLSNTTDLKIAETDANVDANSPYTQIVVKFFDGVYSKDIDSATNRSFGAVIDVGTHSGIDGSTTASGTVLTSVDGGIPTSTYDSGTVFIRGGTDEGESHTILSTTATTVTITGSTFTSTDTGISFSLQRATPVTATLEEVYEKVQRQLRLAADINDISSATGVIVGETNPELLVFVGDTLITQQFLNPATGTSDGLAIEGFDPNDTNRLTQTDNGGVQRNFPFVAAGTINFNANLVNDSMGQYWMFYEYTERFTNTGFGLSAPSGDTATLDSSTTDLTAELAINDYINLTGFTNSALDGIYVLTGAPAGAGPWTAAVRRIDGTTLVAEAAAASVSLDKNPIDSPDAIIVDDNSATDISGSISAASIAFDYDYDNNVQGGRTAATDANVLIRAIGLETSQFVEAPNLVITQSTGLSFSVVGALERNYSNP